MRYALCALPILFVVLTLLPGESSGQGLLQGISGSLEFNYTDLTLKTTDASGETIKSRSTTYYPRFTLAINTDLLPTLNFNAGGTFEQNRSDLKIDEQETTKTTFTQVRPYVYFTLRDPIYTAGVGYNLTQQTLKTNGSDFTLNNENYLATLQWRPEGLPFVDSQYIRTNTYDNERRIVDTTKDYAYLNTRYAYKGLELRYQGTYNDIQQRLMNIETRELTHNGWATYYGNFFNNRVSLNTTYNIIYQDIRTSTEGTGEVSIQVFPFGGVSGNSTDPSNGALDPNQALIDGNLTASAGINLGLPPLGGDTRFRNIGVTFLNSTAVNRILLWVDRELPANIAGAFPWDIYASADNLNWIPVQHLTSAPFGPFQNSFEIRFSDTTAKYIKVVTRPLSPGVLGADTYPSIFVTELQLFLQKPAEGTENKITQTTQNYSLDVKANLLNIPMLYYNLDFLYSNITPNGLTRYFLSNGVDVSQRFSRILSGRAKVAMENVKDPDTGVNFVYDASLEATPLKTLTNRLVFTGRNERTQGQTYNTNSILLYNIAELYKGLEINLNGGLNFTKQQTGQKLDEVTVNLIAYIIPYPTFTMTLDYTYTGVKQSGGGLPSSNTSTQTGQLTIAWNPFRTLFLVASLELFAETGRDTVWTQNYGLNWSPFPDGALQFRFFYNQEARTGFNEKETIINPGVRWNITSRSYLDLNYQITHSETGAIKVDQNSITANLKIMF